MDFEKISKNLLMNWVFFEFMYQIYHKQKVSTVWIEYLGSNEYASTFEFEHLYSKYIIYQNSHSSLYDSIWSRIIYWKFAMTLFYYELIEMYWYKTLSSTRNLEHKVKRKCLLNLLSRNFVVYSNTNSVYYVHYSENRVLGARILPFKN